MTKPSLRQSLALFASFVWIAAANAQIVPELNSNSSSTRRVLLDFNGYNYTPGAVWYNPGGGYSGQPGNVPAFDMDGNTASFSTAELNAIRETWSRVAEKFSPFNINVTTVDPGGQPVANSWARIVVGDNTGWYPSAGGVAFMDTWTYHYGDSEKYGTGWVFSNALGPDNPKFMAEAAAHEFGHIIGLNHQRAYSGSTLTQEYSNNGGSTIKAPTMGNSYSSARGLWWNGTTTSSTTIQDDMAVIASRLSYRADDASNTLSGATQLVANALGNRVDIPFLDNGVDLYRSGVLTRYGVISQTTDVDFFKFSTLAPGAVTIQTEVAPFGATLDSTISLYNSLGVLLATQDLTPTSANPTLGLAESLFFNLTQAGTYYVAVGSHGLYGDVGSYRLFATSSLNNFFFSPVPEPSTYAMIGTFAVVWRWRRRAAKSATAG
jgi:serralysin